MLDSSGGGFQLGSAGLSSLCGRMQTSISDGFEKRPVVPIDASEGLAHTGIDYTALPVPDATIGVAGWVGCQRDNDAATFDVEPNQARPPCLESAPGSGPPC
jgi:hypothetical protein